MSIRKRSRIQHCSSPKNQILKQSHKQQSFNSTTKSKLTNENFIEFYQKDIINEMEHKILKIMKAYKQMEKTCRQKDEMIKLLQRQNYLLKQRSQVKEKQFYEKQNQPIFTQKNSNNMGDISIIQPFQYRTVHRSLNQQTLVESSRRQNQYQHKNRQEKPAPIQNTLSFVYSPKSSRVQSFNPLVTYRQQNNSLLEESRNHEYLLPQSLISSYNTSSYVSPIQNRQIITKTKVNKEFIQIKKKQTQQDKGFMQVLGKLKDKIQKYEQDQSLESTHKNQYQNHIQIQTFSKPRISTHIQSFNQPRISKSINKNQQISSKADLNHVNNDKPTKIESKTQMESLKKIWTQRDIEIKKMDQLFHNIDKRLHIAQKQ